LGEEIPAAGGHNRIVSADMLLGNLHINFT